MTAYRTRQEILSIGYIGVMKQGGPSVNARGFCAYRGDEGRRCHIGHLIDDDSYSKRLEGRDAGKPSVRKAANISPDDRKFVIRLQNAHDMAWRFDFCADYTRRVKAIADEYGLEMPEVA